MIIRRKNYILFLACLTGALLFMLTQTAYAEEYHFDGRKVDLDLHKITDQLPKEMQDELGGFKSGAPGDAVESLLEKMDLSYWIENILEETKSILLPSLKMASGIIGVLILISSVNLLTENLGSANLKQIISLCGDICSASAVVAVGENMIRLSSTYLERLCGIMNAMIPITEAIFLAEGSLTRLSVHQSAMLLYIGITSNLNNLILKPMFGVLFGFAVSSTVFEQFGISGFINGTKKFVMIVISIFTMLFSFILGLQTVLSKSADSLGLKTVRLALGSFIPIIGGTLSEALTTVKEGFGVVKSAAGVGGVFVILFLVLPVAVSLFTNNMILSFCHMTAEILGCGKSAGIINGVQSVLSILTAIVLATSLLFIMGMVLLAKVGSGV